MSFFDLQPHQIIGRKVPEVLPHGWSQIQPHLVRALASEAVTYEAILPHRDSPQLRTYRVLYQPPSQTGLGNSVVVVVIDITDAKQKERAIAESESRYRSLVDVLPDAVFVNTQGKISFCNTACVKLLGANSPEDIIGKSPYEIIHASYHENVTQRIDYMRSTGLPVGGMRQKVVRLDGQAISAHVVATPVSVAGQQSILVCMHDLSEQEQLADQLQSVLGSVPDAIVLIDEAGRVLLANEASQVVLGYSPEELIGRPLSMLLPENHRNELNQLLNSQSSGPAGSLGICHELQAIRKDGTVFPIELTISESQWQNQRQFTGVIHDITNRKRLEAQIQQSQKMEAVGRLAGGVAHDFNNLLTVINGYSELIACQLTTDDPLLESIQAIQEAGDRAARLTKQLLTFSRKAQVQPTLLDLNQLIAESIKMLRRLIGEDIKLVIEPGEQLAAIRADAGQIEQVLMNLLVNARDAMLDGGSLTIKTKNFVHYDDESHTDTAGEFIELSITDTGQGMSPAIASKIFEPFFTTKEVGSGTGLGLAVVHGIIDQNGGRIEVDSQPGVGTCFRIFLPAAK